MAPEPWSSAARGREPPSSPLDAVRPADRAAWRELHLAPGRRFAAPSLADRTIVFEDGGEEHSARVVGKHNRRQHLIETSLGREYTIELNTEGKSGGLDFHVQRTTPEVLQRKARKMARATQRMPELRAGLLEILQSGRLEAAFDALDRNGDGKLSVAELQDGLAQHLSREVPKRDLKEMFEEGGDSEVSKQEFLKVLACLDASRRLAKKVGARFRSELESSRQELMDAFDGFDTDGDGVLSREELVAGLKNAGIRLTKADQKELMAVLDSDGDGTIDYNEFVQMASQDEDQQRKVREVQRKCVRRVPPFAGRGR